MSPRRLSTWLLFAVAIAAVLSHVCVLPHAHADEPVAIAHEHDAERDTGDDAVHGASCEVLRASPPPLPVLDFTPGAVSFHDERGPRVVVRPPAVVARGPAPPLFLLHAALLI